MKSKNIKNNNQIIDLTTLREHAISVLEKLDRREIDVDEAGVVGKLCESIVSTVKVQLEYSKMVNRLPNIPFIGECTGNLIEQTSTKKLLSK